MKKLTFILLAILAVACSQNPAPKPEHLLDRDEMVNILYDVALLQSIKSYKPAVLDSNNVYSHTYIYKKYKIDSLTFAQNNTYYASDIEEYEKIEKKVSERIKENQQKLTPAKDTVAKEITPATNVPKP